MRGIAVLLLAAWALIAQAQEWPQRPVRMLVGFGAGGGTDILARIVAPQMGVALGQPVVVENRPGAGGSIAANAVAKAEPDGYTAFLLNNGHAVSAVMLPSLPYDPVADFQPVSMVATMPLVILSGPRAGFGSLQGLIEVARHNPGKLNLASVGIGSTQHFAAELLFHTAGVKLVHVPYKGLGGMLNDLVAGHVQVGVVALQSVQPHLQSGRLRMLGELEVQTWYGVFAPAGTPPAVVAKLNADFDALLQDAQMREFLAKQGMTAGGGSPERLGGLVQRELARWTRVVKLAGIKAD